VIGWTQNEIQEVAMTKHLRPTDEEVQGLSDHIHGSRYDAVAEFYRSAAAGLRESARKDRQEKGYRQLATILDEAAVLTDQLEKVFTRAWKLSLPHMPHG
jgi:hypothetical protein